MYRSVETINQYFDPRKFNRKDLERLLIENRETADLALRVAPYELKFDREGNPNFAVRKETRIDMLEVAAYERMRKLADDGEKYILWISPPSEEAGYVENRFVVAVVGEAAEEIKMECRGICAQFNEEECVELGNKISGYRKFINGDDLRSNPIPIAVDEEGEDWIDVLEGLIDLPQVWQAIRKGVDLNNLNRMEEVSRVVEETYGDILRRGMKDQGESIYVGALIEQFVEKSFGIRLVAGGGHGMSNTAVLGKTGLNSPFLELFNRSTISEKGENYCRKCHEWYNGDKCPYCGMRHSSEDAGSAPWN